MRYKTKAVTLLVLGAWCSVAWAGMMCPVCGHDAVTVGSVVNYPTKPSKNIAVWNRSACGNPFFDTSSMICPKDWYAYSHNLERWELRLLSYEGFALPIDDVIKRLPLPVEARRKSNVVYGQRLTNKVDVTHSISFWFEDDLEYLKNLREYADREKINLRVRRGENGIFVTAECRLAETDK